MRYLNPKFMYIILHLFPTTAERQRQLERSRSRVGRMMPVSVTEIDINGSASPSMVRTNNTNNAGGRSRGRRGGDQGGGQDGDALMERLRQL